MTFGITRIFRESQEVAVRIQLYTHTLHAGRNLDAIGAHNRRVSSLRHADGAMLRLHENGRIALNVHEGVRTVQIHDTRPSNVDSRGVVLDERYRVVEM